ncbi:MAG: restriction endonuclease [Anaerolineae bacterium]|nr:restriction endonuclease [Anaerolineae bacterium]
MNRFFDVLKGFLPIILGIVVILSIMGLFLALSHYDTRQTTSGICAAAFIGAIVVAAVVGLRSLYQRYRFQQRRQIQQREKTARMKTWKPARSKRASSSTRPGLVSEQTAEKLASNTPAGEFDQVLNAAGIGSMSSTEFRAYVMTLLAHQGYETETKKPSFSMNMVVEKDGVRHIVEVKSSLPGTKITESLIRQVSRQKDTENCDAAMIVTNGSFSEHAVQLALSVGCELIDRARLAEWIVAYQTANE